MPEVPPVPDDGVEPERELTVEPDADAQPDPWADAEFEIQIDSDLDSDPGFDPDAGRAEGAGDAATDLPRRVIEALADDGPLARAMPGFEPRPSQRRMAGAVANLLRTGGVLLAEAGTGTGKTLAYLVPAILSGERVVISTGTRNLQDQIFYKDLPELRDALGIDFSATYMKGRGNYLCLHRFEAARTEAQIRLLPAAENDMLERIAEWAGQTETGDRAEIEDLPDDLPIWNDFAATSENCIGMDCPRYRDCFITTMRQRAVESDLVIVNHHLLCADAAVRHLAAGAGSVIPDCATVVIDEAHQLEDVATQSFANTISNFQLAELDADGRRLASGATAGATHAPSPGDGTDGERTATADALSDADARELHRRLDTVRADARNFFALLEPLAPGHDRIRVTADMLAPATEAGRMLARGLGDLADMLSKAAAPTEDAELANLGRRADGLREQVEFLVAADDPRFVYYLERRRRGIFLRAAPIDVSDIIRELLIERMRAALFTSATLTVDESFGYVRGRLGIDDATELQVPSEFDYRRQAVLYLPRRMPPPGDRGFAEAVAREVRELLDVTAGRAFVLFTSYANLEAVRARMEPASRYPLLVQGTAPRSVLLREFRATPNAVLLATSSFWQGVDVVGDALSCVVIDKLPFASPGDPLVAARVEQINDDGGNAFADYQVPLAILTLLQGLGRLIRHRTDRGVLALLDPRLRTRGYGRRFLKSLPPARVTQDLADVDRFLNSDRLEP
ncbi:MAG: ATP-dependent DNA helicase [Acidobacteria bacterium]|nr:ATP-dependent DNA helicase [Acidobacteriota bacterium]